MPGWIIQGVRGEGKSLAAVGKIKEYMQKGRPVATNLTLFLDKFLPEDNAVISYRLPDHPRLEDLQLLPPAYDPKYKGEDKNGLLVLDELGTWLNSRNWNDKKRLELLNWLFLSRKDHWDLILLAQDHEMIDAQVRTTLCDYLVQASRLDRQKIPYLASTLKFFGLNSMMPRIHRYHVYYGLSTNQPPVETWSFTGRDFYDGYDTNQKFLNGQEALNGTLVDMRATYSNIPVNYLTRRIFVDRLQLKIDQLRAGQGKDSAQMAKKTSSAEVGYLKIGLLVIALLVFMGWRFFSGGFSIPKPTSVDLPPVSAPVPAPLPVTVQPVVEVKKDKESAPVYKAVQTNYFIEHLLKQYRPRLSVTAYSQEMGIVGNIDFYDNGALVESYGIKELHALGVTLLRKPYGVDLIYDNKSFIVTAWRLPKASSSSSSSSSSSPVVVSKVSPVHQSDPVTDKLYH
ncbi:MAG: zonular occludens toxin domain-containing protein [Methylobacter sp.]|nr:zonular occludens toxin domain-containing protein [Methylobacter sp.]